MNPKNKADLERRLTLPRVPNPPADLLDRIKKDIPTHLVMDAPSERDRFTRSVFLNTRVAAAVLLVVTSSYVALQFFSRTDRVHLAAIAPNQRAAAPRVEPATLTDAHVAAAPPVRVAELEQRTIIPAPPAAPARLPRDSSSADNIVARREEHSFSPIVQTKPETADQPSVATMQREEQTMTAVASAPLVADAMPAPAPAAGGAPAATTRSMAPAAPAAGFVAEAKAADLSMKRPSELFGISVDRHAFERIKSAIEHGEQPASAAIDVAALVNYFAGPPSREPRDVRLEAEGSPAPVASDQGRRMVRVTIDTATTDLAPGASIPPVATNASIDVDFDDTTVTAHHLVGGDGTLHATVEPTLLKNTSVTALYDIELAPRGASWQRVATVRLHYRSVADGKEHTVEKTLRRRDLASSWIHASRRHRLASLGAVWGETLKGMAGANDVARRAEELAMQAPDDARARELAEAASATSQLHGGASGSAR